MENTGTGSKAASSDILRLLLTVKESSMKATNVASICKVENVSNDVYICKDINTAQDISCFALDSLHVNVPDIVLVLYCDRDYRSNLKRISLNKEPQIIEDKTLHTKDCGVIIGIIYKENNL